MDHVPISYLVAPFSYDRNLHPVNPKYTHFLKINIIKRMYV